MSVVSRPPRVAVVTGASRQRGIGAAVCRALGRAGVDVFFTHWSAYDSQQPYGAEEDTPEHLRAELEQLGVRAAHLAADLSAPDSPGKILDAVTAQLGTPSVLVNNATHDEDEAPFDQLTAATLDHFYAVNMRGPLLLSIEFARRFMAAPGLTHGRIINLTSGQGHGPMPGKLPYVATKGAVDAVTVTLAAELAPHGVTVNAVDPGPTDTGWMTAEIKAAVAARSPMGRAGEPEDAARLIAFLASPDAAWITGQVIRSRGGF